ncbi:fluoride efflux transporter FluC [Georgenia sp. Z1344]|uniref:fluoride efflux transporter FluC n=1 Tax=Georgenia sp. Z1344 TaxID=3416706 RepID=UPI003CF9F84C
MPPASSSPTGTGPVRPRPEHLQPGLVALVVLGGTLGTAARAGIDAVLGGAPGEMPWATGAVNVVGAAILGALLALLTTVPAGPARRARLLVGTGLLGGFTTYSALSLQTVQLAQAGRGVAALFYALGSVALGVLAAYLAHAGAFRAVRARRRGACGGAA